MGIYPRVPTMTPRRATSRYTALAFATAALAAPAARAGDPPTPTAPTLLQNQILVRVPAVETELLQSVNRIRAARGLRPYRASPGLRVAAARHSTQIARLGSFDHAAPGGAPFWRRLRRYYRPRGYRTWSVGENIVYGSPGLSAAGALQQWLTSSPHQAWISASGGVKYPPARVPR